MSLGDGKWYRATPPREARPRSEATPLRPFAKRRERSDSPYAPSAPPMPTQGRGMNKRSNSDTA